MQEIKIQHKFRLISHGYALDMTTNEKYILVSKDECLRAEINTLKKRIQYLESIQKRLGVEFGVENYKGG
jgi:hypothetical protein